MARRSALPQTAQALRQAVDALTGLVDDDAVTAASAVSGRIDARLAFSGDLTVVALAGATGSGKSSLFNAISQTSLAEPGVRRPTTARAMAATFGSHETSALLDWLDVPRRHEVSGGAGDFDGLVLLDLPDHDSTELSHRDEVDRLVRLVDRFVWVLDPQKYADAALHDRYLGPLASHADVMMVVLNQIDRVSAEHASHMLADLRRLLAGEGLGSVPVLGVSATTGQGMAELRTALVRVIAEKRSAATRLEADVRTSADALRPIVGTAKLQDVSRARVEQLDRTLAVAAGVDVVAEAVGASWRHRGAIATGWPVVAWMGRFRPDPLRSLHLDVLSSAKKPAIEPGRVNRTSLPTAQPVAKARVDSAVRALADEVSSPLPRPWKVALRRAARRDEALLPDHLDRAIATTDLTMNSGTTWWSVVRVLQWLVMITMLVGLGWLGLNFLLTAYLALPAVPVPRVGRLPLPTVLALGGLASGLLLALLSRVGVVLGARVHQHQAEAALRASISTVTHASVIEPIGEVLTHRETARKALAEIS